MAARTTGRAGSGPSVRLGVDLGGSKISIIAIDGAGEVLFRRRVPTPQGDYAGTLRAVAELVDSAQRALGGRWPVGVATPGAVSTLTGLIKNSNSVCLIGRPLREDLAALLDCPVRISNDANCFALSEATDGSGAGAEVVFGVIIGTGTGAGLVVRGQVIVGANGIAGEWGHNPLPWPRDDEQPGPACYCGHQGCIETFLSGPGMTQDHARRAGESLTPPVIVQRAGAGDRQCEETLQRYEEHLARALAHVINLLDPNVIVLGGGMSNIERLYRNVPRLWSAYVFSDRVDTRLLLPRFGDDSGVRGAAWLW